MSERVKEMASKGLWDAYYTLLATTIYGVVLFPEIKEIVDLATLCVFLNKNRIPTLLANTYHAIHSRYGKKGVVVCCVPMLYKWFMA